MKSPLRVMIVEDSESDAALVLRELERAGYETEWERVDSESTMKHSLARREWDLVIADYALPGFDASAALKLVRDTGRDVPFIVFSGQIGEDRAVGLMRAGAHDYVLKDNLARLVPAVSRELKEAAEREQRRLAETALRESEARYRAIVESNTVMMCRFGQDGRLTFVNSTYCDYFGKTRGELIGHAFSPLMPEEDRKTIDCMMKMLHESRQPYTHEHRVVNGRGQIRWNQWTNSAILDEQGQLMEYQAVGRDITEAKRADDELRRLTGELLHLQDEERRRLARELHDTTAQKISAISLNLNYVKSRSEVLPEKAVASLEEALALTESCTREIRTLSYLLHPPELDLLGLQGAINDFVLGFSRRSGIRVQFEVAPGFDRLPEEIETALFRIVQESLTNVHRHSGSDTVSIRLRRDDDGVRVEIQDQGRGFPVKVADLEGGGTVVLTQSGVGLAGMRERLKRLGGALEVESNSRGTLVRGLVPV